jgi:hypothetical protein
MNPLTTIQLADTRVTDRLASARLRASAVARRAALHTTATVEPADLLLGAAGRRPRRAPRWWAAIEGGQPVSSRPTPAVLSGAHTTGDCIAC